jgi:flagellar protein FliO/FliZ
LQFQQILVAAVALIGVLALIWAGQHVFRFGAIRSSLSGRLQVVQMVALDSRRRVILLRCDGTELLLLTGGPADLLLSASITPAAGGPLA